MSHAFSSSNGFIPHGATIELPVPKLRKRSFPIGGSERNVSSGNYYQSVQEFLKKMDLGLFDGKLHEEMEKLSREQLIELAELMSQRSSRPPGNPE